MVSISGPGPRRYHDVSCCIRGPGKYQKCAQTNPPMTMMIFLAITQLQSENLLIGRNSPRSGEIFFEVFFGTSIEK